jgi:hypothetical protein
LIFAQVIFDEARKGRGADLPSPSQASESREDSAILGHIDPTTFLPADRVTIWNPGVMCGIPQRSTTCATLSPRGGGADDSARIQAAINACPIGQVVKLEAGTFIIQRRVGS